MARRIGLIQSRGIGDIIIALPIAQHFLNAGDEVYWPIEPQWLPMFSAAEPGVRFLPVPEDPGYEFDGPMRLLRQQGCDPIFPLMSYLGGRPIADPGLAAALKFDEYKYAVAGVPFERKWHLRLQRDRERELALFARLPQDGRPYVCLHDSGSNVRAHIPLTPEWLAGRRVVKLGPATDNLFDWLTVLERADHLVLIDSCFSNLVEQLNLSTPKTFFIRSPVAFTPVLKNAWTFVAQPPSVVTSG